MTLFHSKAQVGKGYNPLWMDVPIAHSELFRDHERTGGKDLLPDHTVVHPCAPICLGKEA